MSYIEKNLSPGERLIGRARISWVIYAQAWLALILFGVFIVGIIIFLRLMIYIWTTELAVTSHRILFKTGWIARHTRELELNAIEEVVLEQGFWGRLLNFGQVTIHGTGVDDLQTPLIAAPSEFAKDIDSATSAAFTRKAQNGRQQSLEASATR
ncbi:MAG: PH domain-containing protein [Alphaproteobacteria bacterium]